MCWSKNTQLCTLDTDLSDDGADRSQVWSLTEDLEWWQAMLSACCGVDCSVEDQEAEIKVSCRMDKSSRSKTNSEGDDSDLDFNLISSLGN